VPVFYEPVQLHDGFSLSYSQTTAT
jgi:hypothetical protein